MSATPHAQRAPSFRSAHRNVTTTAATADTAATPLNASQLRAPSSIKLASSAGKTGG